MVHSRPGPRTRPPRRSAAALAAWRLCLFLALSAAPAAAETVSVTVVPERPEPGGYVTVVVEAAGLESRGLLVEAGAGAAGLEYVGATATPLRSGEAGVRVEVAYRVLAAGRLSTGAIVLRSGRATVPVAPIEVVAGADPAGDARSPASAAWVAPVRVPRFAAFRIAARAPDGSPLALRPFAVPGLATVPLADGGLLALAHSAGPVELPTAMPAFPGFRFAPASISVSPAPPAVEASRAVGRFTLGLSADPGPADGGGSFAATLELSGVGSLPLVVLPEPGVVGPSGPLPGSAVVAARRDDFLPRADGFAGTVALDLVVSPGAAGRYRLSFPPLAVQDPATGVVAELRTAPLEFEVPPAAAAGAGSGPAIEALRAAALAGLGRSRAAGLAAAALAARDAIGADAFLGALLAAERSLAPLDAAGLRAALAAAIEAQGGPAMAGRPRDALPDPATLLAAAALLFAAGLAVHGVGALLRRGGDAAARRAGTRRSAARVLAGNAAPIALLALALVAAGAAAAAASARREPFGLLPAGAALRVPDPGSGPAFVLDAPAAARLSAAAGGWRLAVLADGRSGWFRDGDVFAY